ncbi:hypothetical protein BYT27DRAFT_7194427 [Phlegmacium glaucopus]|nr:hypothetical protein BYT27DRAFT_7194427 [Phlegmacium glaucopus]
MSINIEALIQARWERNAYLACAALILYEYFLQLDAEVLYFWKQRWSVAKVLFLWNRYYSVTYNIANAVVFLQPRPSYNVCSKFFHWQNTGASLQVVTTHIILELRLWAMYGNKRKILLLFIALTTGEALAMGLVFGLVNPNLIATNEPFPGVFICADGDPLDGTHWTVYYWLTIVIIEFTLLLLALIKAWQHRSSVGGSALMQELTRDSVFYFIIIFWIYIANTVLWFINRLTLDELGTAFAFVISSIFANRLLIAIRSAHFRDDDTDPIQSMRFAENDAARHRNLDSTNNTMMTQTGTGTGTFELTTFNERVGV